MNQGGKGETGPTRGAPNLPAWQTNDAAPDAEATSDASTDSMPMTTCKVTQAEQVDEGTPHVAECSSATWGSNPPSSGRHYDRWVEYGTYEAPIPWGFLVHNLEHGAIVYSYNCPQGCAEELAALKAMVATLIDPTCGKARVVIVPDPALDVKFAASAWRWTLKADCLQAADFKAFFAERVGRSPEPDVCQDGIKITDGMWCPN